MGYRRGRRKEELARPIRSTIVDFLSSWGCRTSFLAGCGILLCAYQAACVPPSNQAPALKDLLTIGVPEGTVTGTELGVPQIAAALTREGLTQVGVDGRVLPRLAERWAWEDGDRRLRVVLRPDVAFHDGTRMTAPMMAKVLTDAFGRASNRAQYSSLASVTSVTAENEFQLLLDLSEPSSFLLEDLELPLGLGSQNGTGAFHISNVGESETELGSFGKYYLGAPGIARVILRSFPTLRTAWTSLLRGDIDMVTNVPPEAVEFVQNDEVQVVSFARRYQYLIAFNSQKSLFRSALVRRALNMAIERGRLITHILRSRAVSATGPLWPQHWAYDKTITPYNFDPGLAVSLLDTAGFTLPTRSVNSTSPPARFRFTCLIPSDYSVMERVALEVQRQLFAVGVDMQFSVLPIAEYTARILARDFDAALIDMNSGPSLARPYNFWRSAKQFKGFNVFGYENAEAERLFNVLRVSTNEAAVRSATSRLQRVLLEDPPALFLVWNQGTRAVRKDFTIHDEPGRDPLYMIWRWTPMNRERAVSVR